MGIKMFSNHLTTFFFIFFILLCTDSIAGDTNSLDHSQSHATSQWEKALQSMAKNIMTIQSKIEILQLEFNLRMSQMDNEIKLIREIQEELKWKDETILTIPRAQLYAKPEFSGLTEEYNVDENYKIGCKNLKEYPVLSIHSFGSCVRLYEMSNCDGKMIPIFEDIANLTTILDFNVTSIGPCFEVPYSENFKADFQKSTVENKDLAQNYCIFGMVNVGSLMVPPRARLFTSTDKSGSEYIDYNNNADVYIGNIGCQNVTFGGGEGLKIKAIDTFGTCVRLYDDFGCVGYMKPWYPGIKPTDFFNGKFFDLTTLKSIGPCVKAP